MVDVVTEKVGVQTATSLLTAVKTRAGQIGDVFVLSIGTVHNPIVNQVCWDTETPRTLEVGGRAVVLSLSQFLHARHAQGIKVQYSGRVDECLLLLDIWKEPQTVRKSSQNDMYHQHLLG